MEYTCSVGVDLVLWAICWVSYMFKLKPTAVEELQAGIHYFRIIEFALAV
jgi:hypothetical protein